MMNAVVVSDLHGNARLYELLLRIADAWKISSVFIAGDLAPGHQDPIDATTLGIQETNDTQRSFFVDLFIPMFEAFLADHRHTHVYAIMGNDDRRIHESLLADFDDAASNFHLVNDRIVELREAKRMRSFFPGEVPRLRVTGYPYVPLGGSLLLDWVKRENRVGIVPPGMDPCMDLEDSGLRSVRLNEDQTTIEEDLADFPAYLETRGRSADVSYDGSRTIHLFHAPPYDTPLDQTAPQGRYEYLRLPDHIGSSEIRRFIEREQPHLVLCGHCHEAVVLGNYRTNLDGTPCVNPGSQAHLDVLSLVQFDPYRPNEMKHLFVNAA